MSVTSHNLNAPTLSRNELALAEAKKESFSDNNYGFWLYLLSDAVIFSILFLTYLVLSQNIADGPRPQDLYSMWRVVAETICLLVSSITFGMATVALVERKSSEIVKWLLITGALGIGFLFLEVTEFADMVQRGAVPKVSGYLSSFYVLVGTHGLHVTVGLIWMAVLLFQLKSQELDSPLASRLARLGVFWHFLDIVWIGIFSVVYLPGLIR